MSSGENLWQVSHLQIIVQKSSQISFWTSWKKKRENFGDFFFSLFVKDAIFLHAASCCWGKIDLLLELKLILLQHNFRFSTIGVINPIAHCSIHVGWKIAEVAWFFSIFAPFQIRSKKIGLFLRLSRVALRVSYNTLENLISVHVRSYSN